ncbi:hypothetical protein [Mesorhizobium sp. ISC11]|uniref:hypothetical protein n=1 Tax=Mesorhizobium sp. ISC11 TaxID=3076428 RepID=UPI00301D116D
MQLPLFDPTPSIIEQLAEQHRYDRPAQLTIPIYGALALIQKSVRRGELSFALSAASTLLDQSPDRLFRRLVAIATEDVGHADLSVVELVVCGASSKTLRKRLGDDWRVAASLVSALCRSTKDRSTDDCYIVAKNHPELADLRASLGELTAAELIDLLRDPCALFTRAMAAWRAAGADWSERHNAVGRPDPKAVFEALRNTGTSAATATLATRAFAQTREALPLVLAVLGPLRPAGSLKELDDAFPPVSVGRDGLPLWRHDKFSHAGIAALKGFLGRPCEFNRWVCDHIEPRQRLRFAGEALFRVESQMCLRRVQYPAALTLRRLADEGFHGLRLADPKVPLDLLRNDLGLLDEFRYDL